MDTDKIKNQINQTAKDNQFTVAPTTAHTHNGTDSLKVSIFNLDITPKPSASSLVGFDQPTSMLKYISIGTGLTYTAGTYTLSATTVTTPIVNVYTGSATWTKPASLKYIIVEVVGGGGKGGNSSGAPNDAGGGGGAGGYSRKLVLVGTLGATETVTVGAGSTGGGTGDTSLFGSHCSASGGDDANTNSGGSGGVGTNGNINSKGGGGNSASYSLGAGGKGGDSILGGGGKSVVTASNGEVGGVYGGGGGGSSSTGSPQIGGNGGAGVVIVTEYY